MTSTKNRPPLHKAGARHFRTCSCIRWTMVFYLSCAISLLLLLNSTPSFLYCVMAASSADSDVCSTLSSQLPGQVAYSQEAAYRAAISSYFYQQARLSPRCVVFPRSTSDVANIIKTIAASRGKAAIRGAGHTPSARAANIDNAVTIDLSNMNTVTLKTAKALDLPSSLHTSNLSYDLVSSEKYQQQGFPELLSTDGGASWGDVYQTLSPLNLISVGGRGTSLGVGSLITGGESARHRKSIMSSQFK